MKNKAEEMELLANKICREELNQEPDESNLSFRKAMVHGMVKWDDFASQQKPEIAYNELTRYGWVQNPRLPNEQDFEECNDGDFVRISELKTRIQPSDLQKEALLERILEFLKDNFDGTDREFESAAIEFKKEYESFYQPSDLQKEVEHLKEIELPDFLYIDSFKEICIGYHGDTVVTDEWNKWLQKHIKKSLPE